MKQKHTRKGAKTLRIWGFLFALWFVGAGLAAQSRQVTGTVSDRNGPMAGVAVTVQGTGQGTTTNAEGRYAIAASSGQTLQFSFLGYDTKEMQVGTQTVIDVDMEESALNLDEVIVIGYGTTTKRDLTGSVSSVKGEALTLSPAANPLVNIQGKVPGLDITQSSGQPGAGVDIQLRGTRSFTASGNPLFLIDGMPGDYSTLNPNDILSIDVLKDASSTAVYGSSGANGVIIITTKKPQAGKVTVDFNAYYGINGWSLVPKMRGDGPQYIDALRDAGKAAGRWTSEADDRSLFENPDDYDLYEEGYFMNWNKALMQTASVQNYSLSVAGGNERTKAYMSLNYSDERGQYKADKYKVYSSVMRVENQATAWLKIGSNLQASYVDRSRAYANLENAIRMFPIGKMYNEDEEGNIIGINPHPVTGSRVYNLLLNTQDGVYDNLQNNFRIHVQPYLEINPIAGLSILTRASASLSYNKTKYFQGFESYQWYAAGGTDASVLAQLTQNRSYSYNWENILTYNRSFDLHNFTLTGVTTWSHSQNENSFIQQTNIKENVYKWNNMDISSTNTTASSGYSMSKGMGYVGRLNYSYDGKYLASASIRYDGSSKLYKDTRWSTFPAFSVGWRISEENFLSGSRNWLDNLKIRGSYGVTGTAGIDAYSSVQELESGTMLVGGIAQNIWKFSQNVTNPNLTWEKSKTVDIGLDFTVLKGRVDVVLDWYQTKTDGVIWNRPLPVVFGAYATGSSGQYQRNMNIAATKNTGWELAVNTVNVRTREVNWTSTVTFSTNKEKITKLFEGSDFLDTSGSTGYVLKVGEAVKSYWGYKLDGIWQLDEIDDAEVFNAAPGDIKINIPGMYRETDPELIEEFGRFYKFDDEGEKVYYSAANKYTVSAEDNQILGQTSPKWQLGFQNTVTYKGFDLSVYAFMRMGQTIKYELVGAYDPSGKENFPSYFDYWTEDNPSNKYPAIHADRSISDYTGYSSLQYVDGSFFKIKNITLGYTLPDNLTKKLRISKLRVYGTVTNPVIVSKSSWIKQYDPEMAGSLNYPLTRQLVFGVNFSF